MKVMVAEFHAEPVLETGRTAASHGLQATNRGVGCLHFCLSHSASTRWLTGHRAIACVRARCWKLRFERRDELLAQHDLYFQNETPGKDKEANWLPSPKSAFNLTMRLYAPKSNALAGKWNPPPITRAQGLPSLVAPVRAWDHGIWSDGILSSNEKGQNPL